LKLPNVQNKIFNNSDLKCTTLLKKCKDDNSESRTTSQVS